MTDAPLPQLTAEEIAEGHALLVNGSWQKLADYFRRNGDRLLASAERLADCERQLAEADAAIETVEMFLAGRMKHFSDSRAVDDDLVVLAGALSRYYASRTKEKPDG